MTNVDRSGGLQASIVAAQAPPLQIDIVNIGKACHD
jgi:hypothetical protein